MRLKDKLYDPRPDPEERLVNKAVADQLSRAIRRLPANHMYIMLRLYGFHPDWEGETPHDELAKELGCSEKVIRRAEQWSLGRLREWLSN